MNHTSSLGLSSVVVASKEMVLSQEAEDVVVLDLREGVYHTLNSTAARIWNMIQHPCTAGAICDALLDEYDVEPDVAAADVLSLLDVLNSQGLVQVRRAA